MLNPLMLLGLLGLSVPIIIHLIQRQRLRPQPFATLQFLTREDVANAFAPVPRDLLQLLLRLLLLLLFILLMARLAIGSHTAGPRTLAVILDQSMSMQQQHGATSLFEQSRQDILALIDSMTEQDRLALYLVGDKVTQETGYLQDKAVLRKTVQGFAVSDSGGLALMPTLRGAVNQLRARREVNPCVLVFTDMQRSNFAGALPEQAGGTLPAESVAFRTWLAASQVKVLFVAEPAAARENVAVLAASFAPPRVYLGASGRLTAVVRNDTDKPRDVAVQFQEGPTAGERRQLQIGAGETVQVDLTHRFESPVDTACRVEVDADDLPGDNLFYLPMRMKGRQQVLLVSPGEESTETGEAADVSVRGRDLLNYAMNPGEAVGQGADTYVNVRRITPAFLERMSLPLFSMVVLYGVGDLSAQSAHDLEQFVANGGGLYIVLDHDLSPQRFNDSYAGLLNGLAIGQEKAPTEVPGMGRAEAAVGHPLLAPLRAEAWGGINDLYFHRYYGVQSEGKAKSLLRADNGDWLAATIARGQGRIVVQLFGCDLVSSTVPRSTVFVPMVQEIVAYLGHAREDEPVDTLRVGQGLRLATPELRGLTGDVEVSGPLKATFPVSADGSLVAVDGLLRAGAYEVVHHAKQTGRKRWLTVNPVAGESDLTPLVPEEQDLLFGKDRTLRLPYAQVAGQFAARHEVTGLLLILVLLALLLESVFGAWQSRAGNPARHRQADAEVAR